MIGGEDAIVKRIEPIFSALAPNIDSAPRTPGREKVGGTAEHGYLHCGPSGAGHFVKMVHNGIEYGIMASYAEGLNILHHANAGKQKQTVDAETTPLRHPEYYPYDLNIADIAEVWRRGSVISFMAAGSWPPSRFSIARTWRSTPGGFRTRGKAAGQSRRRSTSRFRLPYSALRSTNASVREAKATSPTSYCPRFVSNLAGMRKSCRKQRCGQQGRRLMAASDSDALVLFGVTGDLAHKMIFPALYAMVKKGALKVPVIGVAFPKWSMARLHKRVTDSIERSGGIDNKRAFQQLLSLLKYVSGDYKDPATFASIKEALGSAAACALPGDTAIHVRNGD
jgi:hypothetical protein